MRKTIRTIAICGCALLCACQQEDEWQRGNYGMGNGGLQLNIQTEGLMNKFTVTTRGTDTKTPEEQEIKSLHIFIFDADGNYLEASDQHRYQGYRNIPEGKTVMNIDREGWADNEKAKNATVIAVANVEDGTFQFNGADQPPTNVPGRTELEGFKYTPLVGRYITELPESGMPMYGRVDGIDLTSSNANQSVDIPMKAMMARIDVSLQINSDNSDVTGTLPQLTVTECKVLNAPKGIYFTEDASKETSLDEVGKETVALPPSQIETIQNRKGTLEYTFYTFENLQEPANPNYDYPQGISEEEKQQYKPELADRDNSLAFQFSGSYITYNGASNNATYTLYLGANHTDDFKVLRNKQYKNNVTIKGIVKAGNNPDHITFDTRVDITESNPYFVSMLKDRTLDSHFNVVPMDIYFFNTNPSNPNPPKQTMTVEIENPDKASWVRMEKIEASYMETGTAPSVASGPDLLTTNEAWHAGNGKRRYFTTDLVTSTLTGNTSVKVTNSRDRIYFYIDENLDVWHLGTSEERTRTANVKMTYYEDGVEKGSRELILEQAKLLEVTFKPDDSGDVEAGVANKRIYIEAYEEYRDHGDPLNEYDNNQIFYGLPWEDYTGGSGTTIGRLESWNLLSTKCSSNFYEGHGFTQKIANEVESVKGGSGTIWDPTTYSYAHLDLNSKPKTAAGYCFLKNKRGSDGSVPNPKWYMPGIRELERILEDYYIEYPEFQNNYYWSSAAGEGGGLSDENANYARATKAYIGTDGKFHYYESGTDNTYTGENGTGGFTPRRQSLRIRAARTDANPQ